MFDIFKEGAEAWFQRIKSPILGSILLSFIVINWKVLFFVIFSDAPTLTRFAFFDQNADWTTLFLLPVAIGTFLGVFSPFLNYYGSYVVKGPVEKARIMQAESASVVMTRKNQLAAQREEAAADFKEAALRNAKAEQAIDDADLDEGTREVLNDKVQEKSLWPPRVEWVAGADETLGRQQKHKKVDEQVIYSRGFDDEEVIAIFALWDNRGYGKIGDLIRHDGRAFAKFTLTHGGLLPKKIFKDVVRNGLNKLASKKIVFADPSGGFTLLNDAIDEVTAASLE